MKKQMLPLLFLFGGTLQAQYTHDVVMRNDLFMPELLVVEAGDSIALQLTGGHTLTEVSPATFRANGIVSNGGIRIGAGVDHTGVDADRATFSITDPGEYFFVSEGPGATIPKMRIVVIPATHTGVSASVDQRRPVVFPNPADDVVRFPAHAHLDMIVAEAFDRSGRRVLERVVRGNEPLNVVSLPPGLYTMRLSDGLNTVYGVEQLLIDRVGNGAL